MILLICWPKQFFPLFTGRRTSRQYRFEYSGLMSNALIRRDAKPQAQVPKGKKRTPILEPPPRKRRATPKQLTETLQAARDAGCNPRGAFLGADGSIKLDFVTEAAKSEGTDWDKMIDAAG